MKPSRNLLPGAEPPDLSSPLEWLLQSPQSTPEMLALAVWEACGDTLQALGEALFGERASAFVRETLAACLLEAETYAGAPAPHLWVLRVALHTAQRMAQAPDGAVERRFLEAAGAHSWDEETLRAVRGGARRRRLRLRQAAPAGDAAGPFGVHPAFETAAPPRDQAAAPRWEAFLPPEMESAPDEAALRLLTEAVLRARRLQFLRKQALRRREALFAAALALIVLAGVRLGQRLDRHGEETAAPVTQVVVVEVTPTPQTLYATAAAETDARPSPVYHRTEEGETLASLAQRFNADVADLLAWNEMDDPQTPLTPGRLVIVRMRTMDDVLPTPASLPGLPAPSPLVGSAVSAADVFARLLRSASYWRTLWVDAFIADYGLEGYTGPPQVTRQQVWLARDSRALVLSGAPFTDGAEAWLNVDGTLYHARLPASYAFVRETETYQDGLAADAALVDMLFPARLLQGDTPALRILGEKPWHEYTVLKVEALFPGGLRETWWIEQRYGILLRRMVYTRRGALARDVQVVSMAVNFIPEAGLFTRQRAPRAFALSPRGVKEPPSARPAYRPVEAPPGHVPLPQKTPPPDFVPAAAALTFQWSDFLPPWDPQADEFPPGADVRVFADGYYLGHTKSVPVNEMSPCVRSPDGNLLAWWYPSVGEPPTAEGRGLVLAGLRKGDMEHLWIDFETVNGETLTPRPWMVFSADGAFLYVAADSENYGMGIYRLQRSVLNFYASPRWLFNAFHTGPLALSPSGKQLAWLEYRDTDIWELVLADLERPALLSRQVVTIRMAKDGLPLSVPQVWGRPFPWPQPGLLNCAAPPLP